MPITMYSASVPVLVQALAGLSQILDRAAQQAAERKIEPAVLLSTRLFPDMFPLVRQVQLSCDFAKGGGARLAGVDVPSFPDTETTFEELKARIGKTVAFLQSLPEASITGSETREVKLKVAGNEMTFAGQPYLLGFVLPNVFFHITTAYAILRCSGIDIGKLDYMGRRT